MGAIAVLVPRRGATTLPSELQPPDAADNI
ncbi:hypothetical protein J2736_005001 [Paenibacillus qinlingensis]|uniref:Uncharacterized protein n=1 Tax=Paenibacillus qinlingensis TaxID=1837343 RepID=A0ABU1P360_9BACL|nr:hypothetical protein [Paenibacillus qinlingensis]